MDETVIFYHNPMSRSRIVHWMLEEAGASYEIRPINFEKREQKSPDFLKLNPMGKIPTIIHRGVVITEAAAICAYLADMFPAAELSPPLTDSRRGTYLRWLFFGAGCVEPALLDKMFNRPVPDRPGALGYGSYEDMLQGLEKAVTPGPFVLGDRFSAADLYLASEMIWGIAVKAFEPRPAFQKYVARCTNRAAFIRCASQDSPEKGQLSL